MKVFGGVTDMLGLTDNAGEKAAMGSANAANAYALKLAKENIAFQKEQYSDWKAVYGDIQTNLGSYFKNLTPERLTAMGLHNQQKEFQNALADINKTFAQKGLEGSGLDVSTQTTAKLANAAARAQIRTSAVDATTEQKLSFLNLGLGTGNAIRSNITGAYQSGVNQQTQSASMYMQRANQMKQDNQNAMGDIFGTAMGFMGG